MKPPKEVTVMDAVPYIVLWALTAVLALVSVWLYRQNHPALCCVTAALPTVGAASLFLILLHDLNLPHDDGIPVTTVMRWFMLDDNPTIHEARAIPNAAALLIVAALVFAIMLLLIVRKKSKNPRKFPS